MHETPAFPDLLRLIDERSAVAAAVIGAAPDLDVPVPTCPGWTLADLAQHLIEGRRKWAAVVAAGPDGGPPAPVSPDETTLAAATAELLDALREAGPDRGVWCWWGDSQSPQTATTVARRQLQELTVHTYDAQVALGDPQPLPSALAVEGVDEFLFTCFSTPVAWPFEPAIVDYHVTEGHRWRLDLSPAGARVARLPEGATTGARATATATAGELQLCLYGRASVDILKIDGDRRPFDQMAAWDPTA